jgi:prevent-host-death family protein
MKPKRVTATDLGRNLADLVNRVRYRGEEFLIEKGGESVARLGPARAHRPSGTLRDLIDLARKLGPDLEFADRLEEIVAADNQPLPPGDPWKR